MQKVLVIVGPTASGKSALAVELARKFNGEVISADSRQIYRGLNIGTGKITKREMMGVRHHLLDVASPKRTFTADDFLGAARKVVDGVSGRGKLPIVCGGTGFYIDALVGRATLPNVPPNPALRRILHKLAAAELFKMLHEKDPVRAKSMSSASERNNKVRLIRALEIADALGKVPTMDLRGPSFDVCWIGLRPKDGELRRRINARLDIRLEQGMVRETKRLHARGLSYRRMRELGLEYRSLARLLTGGISKKEFENELRSDIWRYARKQLGYWKRNRDIRWFSLKQKKEIETEVKRWLKK
jgi:tRNA dimethylallyltransferase